MYVYVFRFYLKIPFVMQIKDGLIKSLKITFRDWQWADSSRKRVWDVFGEIPDENDRDNARLICQSVISIHASDFASVLLALSIIESP